MEPEFWSPLLTIPTLLLHMTRGLEDPACLHPGDPYRPVSGQERPASASWDRATVSLALPFSAAEGQLGSQVGGGVANSAVGGELPPLQLSQLTRLAQGLSFSISQMETNWPLYCSAWPWGPLWAGGVFTDFL